jgi:hypothetical protein
MVAPFSVTSGRLRLDRNLRYRDGMAMLPRKPSTGYLARRLAKNAVVVAGLLAVALGIGAAGYHNLNDLPWLDALLNAAMILTGMGPVDRVATPAGKVFAIFYALFGGVFFLSMVAVLLAPVAQHLLHRFHLELDEHREARRARHVPTEPAAAPPAATSRPPAP